MEGLPILSVPSSRGSKRSKPGDGGSDGKKKEKNGIKKAYIPSYVQAGEKCVVCGDNSTGTHYRAMTCEGCKGFFRRTIQKSKGGEPNLTCKKEGHCEVTPQTRNACQFCRYKKCLAVKMDPASVLNEMERSNLQRLIATNRKERQKKNKRSLCSEEWAELRQLAHSYKSPSVQTFFSFFFQNKGSLPKSYEESKMASPGVWHAFNFVRNIPGIDKIPSDDLAVLIKNRLIDVLALLMAEVYNVAENEMCFCDFRLREGDLDRICPQLKNIFRYAKFYSKFVSHDGMVLGCLSATRFLNTDGLELRDPEKVDRAMDYIVNLSLKFWASLENNMLLKELCKGLPDFENIREHEFDTLSRITMMNENLEDIKILIQLHPLPVRPEMSPEFANRSTSTVPSLRSSSAYTTDSSEDEVDSLKLEMSCDEDFRFEQETCKSNSCASDSNPTPIEMKHKKENAADEVATKNVTLTSAFFCGNGYSWQSDSSPSVSFSSKSKDRLSGSINSSSKAFLSPEINFSSYTQPVTDLRNHGVIQQSIQNGLKDTNPSVIQQSSPEIIQPQPFSTRIPQTSTPGVITQRNHIQDSQFKSKSPESQKNNRSPFMHPKLDNLLSLEGHSRVLPPQNVFHSQGDINASGESFQHNDIDNLRKNNENLKEMLKYMCTLMEIQGLYPNLENLENMLSRRDNSPGFVEKEVNGLLRTFTSNLPMSQAHDLSILHHPAITRALASRHLSSKNDTLHNKYYPTSSIQSPFSLPSYIPFNPSPEKPQSENPLPDVALETLRLYHPSHKIELNPFQKNGHRSAFHQVLQQTEKETSHNFDHYHSNNSITKDSVVSAMPSIPQRTDSNQVISSPVTPYTNYTVNNMYERFGNANSLKSGNHNSYLSHKLVSPLHSLHSPPASFILKASHSGVEKSSFLQSPPEMSQTSALVVNKSSHSSSNHSPSSQNHNNSNVSLKLQTAQSSAENSSPINSSSQIHISSNLWSGAEVSTHSRSPQTSTILEEPKVSSAAIGLKKKWLKAHFNME